MASNQVFEDSEIQPVLNLLYQIQIRETSLRKEISLKQAFKLLSEESGQVKEWLHNPPDEISSWLI